MKKIFYCFILLFAMAKTSHAQLLAQDSLAIDDFYYTNFGGHPMAPISSMTWLTITGNRITAINFDGSSLWMGATVTLPSSFGNLTALKKLYLEGGGSRTYFSGFPPELVNLTALEDVGIGGFNGASLGGALLNMPWLKKLSLNRCWAAYISPEISRITGLISLDVGSNYDGINTPSTICDLPNLEYLNLSNNFYPVGILPGIGRLTKLKYYNASGGSMDYTGTIPDSIGYCTELRVLNVSGISTFEGEIPVSITNCHKLSTFWLSGEWYGVNPFFDNITAFPDLDTLILNTGINQTPTEIPAAFSTLSHLTYLSLSGYITGPIPAVLGNCPALKKLSLSSAYFTGSIPASLGNISTLQSLSIGGANITGGIPASLGNLSQLQTLNISCVNIGGTIPASLGNLTQLQSLSLSNCGLSGPVPAALNNLPATTAINLSTNKFTFDSLEAARQHFTGTFTVSPQPNISIRYYNNKLSVSAGGTLANNTYKWYRAGSLYRTVVGDSTLATTVKGTYYVEVTNSIVTGFTLTSNSYYLPIKLCPPVANASLTSSFLSATSFQWQMNDGTGYINISDDANFSGTSTAFLELTNILSSWNGYLFRCAVIYSGFPYYSQVETIKFETLWTGSSNNNWEDAANWNCSAIPDSGTDVVITSGNVIVNSNTTIRSLSLASGVNLTVSPGVTLTVLH